MIIIPHGGPKIQVFETVLWGYKNRLFEAVNLYQFYRMVIAGPRGRKVLTPWTCPLTVKF